MPIVQHAWSVQVSAMVTTEAHRLVERANAVIRASNQLQTAPLVHRAALCPLGRMVLALCALMDRRQTKTERPA